jgi:RNA polymerase sigma-70 factor, ECF subfamily
VDDDEGLIDRLRAGDHDAFGDLVDRYHSRIIRLARSFVDSRAVAEEVAQDTWLAVMRGVDRFEGRSSFRTWLFQICVNRARSTAKHEHYAETADRRAPTVDPDRFGSGGQWSLPPTHWTEAVEDRMEAVALMPWVKRAIEELPHGQRQVVTLRDSEGLSSTEVCQLLSISEGNQRILLHRGRARIRAALEDALRGGGGSATAQ